MALPNEDWLSVAQRLPVGGTRRVVHGRESRANLVIGHESSHYWAYCQRCKEGGKVMKEHVLITGRTAPPTSTNLDLPRDMRKLTSLSEFEQMSIAGFLVRKNMDPMYLPELWYSAERKRLLMQANSVWIGRDLTERSHQKWLHYRRLAYLLSGEPRRGVVLVEDPFSWFKLRYALRGDGPAVACMLGTAVRRELQLALVRAGCTRAGFYTDGDAAGHEGARAGARALQAFGIRSHRIPIPEGKDPKDLTLKELRDAASIHPGDELQLEPTV